MQICAFTLYLTYFGSIDVMEEGAAVVGEGEAEDEEDEGKDEVFAFACAGPAIGTSVGAQGTRVGIGRNPSVGVVRSL